MAADERVHKKTHFGPIAEATPTNPAQKDAPTDTAAAPSPVAQVNGLEQQAQAVTVSEQQEFAHRRDIYSIHGEQVNEYAG